MARSVKYYDEQIEKLKVEREKAYLKEIEEELEKFKNIKIILEKYNITSAEQLEEFIKKHQQENN